MLKKVYTCLMTAVLPFSLHAANNASTAGTSATESSFSIPSETTIDFLSLNMPNGGDRMGLTGLHYGLNLLPIPDFYTGLGVYGATTGDYGGFFAFGLDNDYRPQIYKSLYLDSGLFLGGGGVHSAEVGGGFVFIPHLGLAYQLGNQLLTLDYSYAKFPSGEIASSQVMFGIIFPSDFNFFAPTEDSNSNGSTPTNWQADHFYLSPFVSALRPHSGNTDLNGNLQDATLGLIGMEGGKYLTDRTFVALRAAAAAKGNANGYMSVMAGIGYQLPLTAQFFWINDLFAGSGGGGNVATGNGIQLEADTGFGWQVLPNFMPRVSIGYLDAPNGHFRSMVASLGFNYDLGWLSAPSGNENQFIAPSTDIQHWRVEAFNQTLFDPQRTGGQTGNINLFGASLEQQLDPNWYLSYRSSFAYQGQDAGALATGMIGGGYQLNLGTHWHPHAAVLIGAMGGGGMDVGDGFLVEPEIGLRYDLSTQFGLDISGGRMLGTSGSFHTNSLNVGVVYAFGKLVN